MAVLTSIASRRPAFGPAHWRSLWLCLFTLLLPPEARTQSTVAPSREYQLKAVFLFNFALFTEWPAAAFPEAKSPLVIGVLGDDPFGGYLDGLIKDEQAHDRPLIVQRYRRAEDIEKCHVLFVASSEAVQVSSLLSALKGRSILTVSDLADFTNHGGMVRFLTETGKIRLHINLEAAKAAGLTLSSKVLRPAVIVTSQPP